MLLLHANGLHKELNIYLYLICGGFAVLILNYSRRSDILSDIFYKPPMKLRNTASMKFGPLMPYNMATLDF